MPTRNSNHQVVITEEDAIRALLSDMRLHEIVTIDKNWAEKYNQTSRLFDLHDPLVYTESDENSDFLDSCVNEWHIPLEYQVLDVHEYILDKCITSAQIDRVTYELGEFESRKMMPVLKFMIYFVANMRKNNIVWGVGRGSSVASYVLYLIGIHKIDSLKYNLDVGEFLR
jgi:DNA polymerase III alpha subunit